MSRAVKHVECLIRTPILASPRGLGCSTSSANPFDAHPDDVWQDSPRVATITTCTVDSAQEVSRNKICERSWNGLTFLCNWSLREPLLKSGKLPDTYSFGDSG